MKDIKLGGSRRYINTLYTSFSIFNPEPPSPKEHKTTNFSRYRKIVYDYEGFINKEDKEPRSMKKMKSAISFLEDDRFGKVE